MNLSNTLAAALATLFLAAPCLAQEAVHVGKGSYAASPPPNAGNNLGKIESQQMFLVNDDGRPIPSNKWWTQLVVSQYARMLWAYPYRVDTSENGVDLNFPIKWLDSGSDPLCDYPLTVSGKDFHPTDSRAKDWSDWSVSFRMGQSKDQYMDVTLGEGMPFAWFEYHGVQPVLSLPAGVTPVFFDTAGKPIDMPYTGDCIGVTYQDRSYGIFAPDGTKFQLADGKLEIEFAGDAQFLSVAALPAASNLEYFHRYAYAIPRSTTYSWKYDLAKGTVTTFWHIAAQPLKGADTKTIQGWLPHQYRDTVNDLAFDGMNYLSPRGQMRCATGNDFSITYTYTGIVPNLPAPKQLGGAHEYDPDRMHTYLADVAAKPNFGADTYWGGKDILRFGQCALMAQQTHDSTFDAFRDGLRSAMENWYTYEPGKKDHYFCYYPHWKSLVGVNPSYGSEGFNDHHFHYGYFTFATALLASYDRQFAKDYGPMATLVAKDYANWDRKDQRFPFLRTFDVWAGHSWAGGTSSPGGENQESSSEAVQGWAGLVYLGQALGDKDMLATGVMGYAIESRAALDYWFNAGGDSFPPEWRHKVTGMVWGGGKAFGTYFTGDPAWIYGINWLPASPMLSYLVRDPAFARQEYENMKTDVIEHDKEDAAHDAQQGKPHEMREPTIKDFGSALGSVMMGYVLMYDPNFVAAQLDDLWNEPGDNIAHNANEMTIMYYMAHSMQSMGQVDWDSRTDSPTSMVYINNATHTRHILVWNPMSTPRPTAVYEHGEQTGEIVAAPQGLTDHTEAMSASASADK
jgi:endoglucanase Acf2